MMAEERKGEETYTIERVGEYISRPVYKFLVYEKPTTPKSDTDIFLLKIGPETFGYIRRREHARPVFWSEQATLTELDFFTVVDHADKCLRLDVMANRRDCCTKVTIDAIYQGLKVRIPPSRVFAWCDTPRDIPRDMLNDEIQETEIDIVYLQQKIDIAKDEEACARYQEMLNQSMAKKERLQNGLHTPEEVLGKVSQLVEVHRIRAGGIDNDSKVVSFFRDGFELMDYTRRLPAISDDIRDGDYFTVSVPKEAAQMIINNVRDPRFEFCEEEEAGTCVVVKHRRAGSNSMMAMSDMYIMLERIVRLMHGVIETPELLLRDVEKFDINLCLYGNTTVRRVNQS